MRRSFLVVLCLLVAESALAWGQEGHRIVCQIAYLSLSQSERATVDQLTKAFVPPPNMQLVINSFPDACIFADEARANARNGMQGWERFNKFNNWHFLNLPRSSETVETSFCAQNCVLTGIASQSAALKAATDDQARAEALFFLSHFTGDAHQPLHISYADDQGGNLVQVQAGFYRDFVKNLHSVWDTGIILKALGDKGWKAYARVLKSRIKSADKATWLASRPIDWAQESYVVTTTPDVKYCVEQSGSCVSDPSVRVLGQDYQDQSRPDVELRLQKAGARLANLLRKNLPQ